ncbi:hypothetical protein Tco_1313099 [Tanacetum coccineum]
MEQPTGPTPDLETADLDTIDMYYETVNLKQEVACLMLSSMSPDLQRTLKKYNAYDMLKELKTMFKEQAKQELFEIAKAFYACKQDMGKTIAKLHAILKLHEKGIPKKAETPAVLAIPKGKIQKDNKKPREAKGKDKGKNKLAYAPKPKISPSTKRDNPAKDFVCHPCKEGLRESRKLKNGALSLYMGNRMRVAVEAIESTKKHEGIVHELLKMSESDKGLELIQEVDTQSSENTSKAHNEVAPIEQNPGEIHWTAVKAILKYLRNTKDMVLVYEAKPEAELKVFCYADANFQTDKDDTKSQTGYVFVLNGGAVDWKSAKKSTTAMSSTKAEYIATVEASMGAVWMRKFIDGLGGVIPSNKRPMEMLCDNEHAIKISNDPGILKGSRQFQRKYHYIREVIQKREIVLMKVHTYDNIADPFTKPIPYDKHFEHVMAIGIVPASSLM